MTDIEKNQYEYHYQCNLILARLMGRIDALVWGIDYVPMSSLKIKDKLGDMLKIADKEIQEAKEVRDGLQSTTTSNRQ